MFPLDVPLSAILNPIFCPVAQPERLTISCNIVLISGLDLLANEKGKTCSHATEAEVAVLVPGSFEPSDKKTAALSCANPVIIIFIVAVPGLAPKPYKSIVADTMCAL
jgi:hypothetical protein